jgi:hypothetical protein
VKKTRRKNLGEKNNGKKITHLGEKNKKKKPG